MALGGFGWCGGTPTLVGMGSWFPTASSRSILREGFLFLSIRFEVVQNRVVDALYVDETHMISNFYLNVDNWGSTDLSFVCKCDSDIRRGVSWRS